MSAFSCLLQKQLVISALLTADMAKKQKKKAEHISQSLFMNTIASLFSRPEALDRTLHSATGVSITRHCWEDEVHWAKKARIWSYLLVLLRKA